MRIHLAFRHFEFGVFTRHYCPATDAMRPANLIIRWGPRVWSWQKGYRNIAADPAAI